MRDPLRRLRRLVREGPSDAPGSMVDALGRAGLVAYGVVHLLIAWLALQVAFGVPDGRIGVEGALAAIAASEGGAAALVVVAGGLLAFAVWQLTAAVLGFRWVDGGERFRKRAGATAKAIACIALAVAAAAFVDGRDDPARREARALTAQLLTLPGGRFLVALFAGVVVAVAVAMTYTGVRRTFLDDLDLADVTDPTRRGISGLGVVGHLARALSLMLVGVGIGTAAWLSDSAEAGGLDFALRGLAATGPGSALLVVVAAGFAAFGVFCFADAVYRRA